MLRTRTRSNGIHPSYTLGHNYPINGMTGDPTDLTTNGGDAIVHYTYSPNGLGSTHTTASKRYEETIIDDGDSHISEKPVLHTWTRREAPTLALLPFQPSGGGYLSSQNAYRKHYYVGIWDGDYLDAGFHVPNMASLSDMRATAFLAMLPQIRSGVSLVNFVLELKDLRRMFEVWNKRKNALGNITNAHLNVSFGWIPFFSDIASIVQSLQTLKLKLKNLEIRAGKIQTRRWSRALDTNGLITVTNSEHIRYPWVLDGSDLTWDPVKYSRETRNSMQPMFRAKLVYSYTMPGASGSMRTIQGYLDALGVKLDPSIIWNAIPFSFIVDWVLDVGKFLKSFSIDNLDIRTEILSFTTSVKWQIVHRVSFEHPRDLTGGTYHPSQLAYQTTIGYYERTCGIPPKASVSTSDPGLRQYALAGSLTSSTSVLPRWLRATLFESKSLISRDHNPLITVGSLIKAFLPSIAPNKLPKALRRLKHNR